MDSYKDKMFQAKKNSFQTKNETGHQHPIKVKQNALVMYFFLGSLSNKSYDSVLFIMTKNSTKKNIVLLFFQIYNKVKSDSYINSVRSKILDNFTSSDPKYYGADYDMPENHGTANIVVTDSVGNAVVATSTLNTQ